MPPRGLLQQPPQVDPLPFGHPARNQLHLLQQVVHADAQRAASALRLQAGGVPEKRFGVVCCQQLVPPLHEPLQRAGVLVDGLPHRASGPGRERLGDGRLGGVRAGHRFCRAGREGRGLIVGVGDQRSSGVCVEVGEGARCQARFPRVPGDFRGAVPEPGTCRIQTFLFDALLQNGGHFQPLQSFILSACGIETEKACCVVGVKQAYRVVMAIFAIQAAQLHRFSFKLPILLLASNFSSDHGV
mmetsp:Transcript_44541/g.117793  ORF Transcript_44541/g.117793 Transcript_44541/m.117793 type:complete len:243 (+) Transcript_44541:1048-1776(+)